MSRTFEEQQLDNIRKDLDQMTKDMNKVVMSLENINVGIQRIAFAKCPIGDSDDAGHDNEKPEDIENTYKRLVSGNTENPVKPERDKTAIKIAAKSLYRDGFDSLRISQLLDLPLADVRSLIDSDK